MGRRVAHVHAARTKRAPGVQEPLTTLRCARTVTSCDRSIVQHRPDGLGRSGRIVRSAGGNGNNFPSAANQDRYAARADSACIEPPRTRSDGAESAASDRTGREGFSSSLCRK